MRCRTWRRGCIHRHAMHRIYSPCSCGHRRCSIIERSRFLYRFIILVQIFHLAVFDPMLHSDTHQQLAWLLRFFRHQPAFRCHNRVRVCSTTLCVHSTLCMSYKIGARKPEPTAFFAAAAALSLDPSSCAFIDDLGELIDTLWLLRNMHLPDTLTFSVSHHLLIPGINLKAARKLGFSTVKMLPK